MSDPLFVIGNRPSVSERVAVHDMKSGGRLAVAANPHAPTVTIAGMLQGGVAMADDGRFTVPSVTAAMLERGTRDFSRMALAAELEDHGLQLDVRVSSSAPVSVAFSVQGLAEMLPRMVDLLESVLKRPSFPEEELEKIRQRIFGVLQHERQNTGAVAYGGLTRALYPDGHPLRRRKIEDRERELAALTREDLEAFHARHYGGRRMVCAVVGDVDGFDVQGLFGERLFNWGTAEAARPAVPDAPDAVAGLRVEAHLEDRPNLDVFMGHAGRLAFGAPDYPAAMLANACLGQSTLTSRLGVAVRDDAGLTYGINSGFFGTVQIPGPWVVHLGVSAENLDRALGLCRDVMAEFLETGPTEAELDDERQAWAGSYQVGLATNVGMAMELVKIMVAGEPIERMDRFPDAVRSATAPDVLEALRRHIRPESLVVSVAGTLNR